MNTDVFADYLITSYITIYHVFYKNHSMTNKSVKLFFLATCSMMALTSNAQSLLPKPQSFVKAKGFFPSAPENVKVENLAGDVAENIYSKPWLKAAKNDARRVVRFDRMANPSSPEAYRLHITSDTLLVSAATADGFRYAWQTIGQLTSKSGIVCCDVDDAPNTQPEAIGGYLPLEKG